MFHALNRRTFVGTLGAALAVEVIIFGGCATRPSPQVKLDKPISETMAVDIQGHQVVGFRLLQTNGVSFCGGYRADHGLVVCSHFDLEGLEKAGIPAAMAKNWKVNGLKGELDAKVEKVNSLAAARGISVGMTVREALEHLIDKSASPADPNAGPSPQVKLDKPTSQTTPVDIRALRSTS